MEKAFQTAVLFEASVNDDNAMKVKSRRGKIQFHLERGRNGRFELDADWTGCKDNVTNP